MPRKMAPNSVHDYHPDGIYLYDFDRGTANSIRFGDDGRSLSEEALIDTVTAGQATPSREAGAIPLHFLVYASRAGEEPDEDALIVCWRIRGRSTAVHGIPGYLLHFLQLLEGERNAIQGLCEGGMAWAAALRSDALDLLMKGITWHTCSRAVAHLFSGTLSQRCPCRLPGGAVLGDGSSCPDVRGRAARPAAFLRILPRRGWASPCSPGCWC